MVLSIFFYIDWFGCAVTCYYAIRPVPNKSVRMVVTLFLCIISSCISCQNLPQFDAFSILTVALCWLTTIRLIHLTVLSRSTSLTFQSFLLKIFWIYFPVLPKNKAKSQWPIIFHLILIVMKLIINHWIYRWFISCETRVSYERIFVSYLYLMTISYALDAEVVLVRILTRDEYILESFTNFPIFSLSLREFWGQRYNRFINTILKESVFEPVRLEFSSSTIAGLISFIVSGFLHVNIAYVAFDDISSLFPTFIFFLLHGIGCCFEANMKIQLPQYLGWLVTHLFLLITSPLMLTPFIKEGSAFFMLNPPPLLDVKWIPKLPLPNFCLQ